jgi:hypothetical protein
MLVRINASVLTLWSALFCFSVAALITQFENSKSAQHDTFFLPHMRGRNLATRKAALGLRCSEAKPHTGKLFRDLPETPSRRRVMRSGAA